MNRSPVFFFFFHFSGALLSCHSACRDRAEKEQRGTTPPHGDKRFLRKRSRTPAEEYRGRRGIARGGIQKDPSDLELRWMDSLKVSDAYSLNQILAEISCLQSRVWTAGRDKIPDIPRDLN